MGWGEAAQGREGWQAGRDAEDRGGGASLGSSLVSARGKQDVTQDPTAHTCWLRAGFYQIMKIAVAPTVVVLEFFMFRKLPSFLMQCSVVVVCLGITLATVTDTGASRAHSRAQSRT